MTSTYRPTILSDAIAGYRPPLPLSVTATGASGLRYEFRLNPIGTAHLDRPGVYVFCKPSITAKDWEPIYWGETGSFESRLSVSLLFHHQWDRIRAAGATHIGTLHVPGDLAQREAIETDRRHAYPTPCNDQ